MAPPSPSRPALYDKIWRWHFYAGLFVTPFALVFAVTGAIYLFRPQLEAVLYRDLYFVAASPENISADQQLAAALAQFPGHQPLAYLPPESDSRSALVRLEDPHGAQLTVAVNPHSGAILGSIVDSERIFQTVRELHGKLLSGQTGQAVMELAASWAMVLILTGLYLWWPRQGNLLWGVFLPRLRYRGRPLFRDLHAVTGIWISALLIFLILSGLPWSVLSGKLMENLAGHVGKGNPTTGLAWDGKGSRVFKSASVSQGWVLDHAQGLAGAAQSPVTPAVAPSLSLAQVLALARQLPGISLPFEIRLPVDSSGVFSLVTDHENDPAAIAYVHLDQYTGKVIADIRWADFGPLAKAISIGISLHEGQYFGWPNQLLGLLACLGLIAVVVSGLLMWWRRRPAGKLGAPPASSAKLSPALLALVVALCLLMPLLAASLVVIFLVEWLFFSARARRRV